MPSCPFLPTPITCKLVFTSCLLIYALNLNAQNSSSLSEKDWKTWYNHHKPVYEALTANHLYDQALDTLNAWIKIKGLPLKYISNFWLKKGLLYTQKGNIILGIVSYKESINHYKELNDSLRLSILYKNLGNNYSRLNDHPSARVYYKKSEKYLSNSAKAEARKRRIKYAIIDSYTYQQEFELALNYLEENADDHAPDTSLLLKKALIYCNQGKLDQAEKLLDKLEAKNNTIEYLETKALLSERKGDFNLAISTRTQLLKLLEKGFKRESIAELIRLSDLHFSNKQYHHTDSLLGIALEFFIPGFEAKEDRLPNLNNAFLDIWLVEALKLKGAVYSQESDLPRAKAYYLMAFETLTKLKHQFNSNLSKYAYGKLSKAIAGDLLEICFQQFDKGRAEVLINEAIRITQHANAFVLRNAIEIRSLLDQLDLDEELKNRFIELEFAIAQPGDTIDPIIFKEYQLLKAKILSKSTRFENYFSQKLVGLRDVQASLPANSKLIKYFVSERKCYIFSIDKQEYDFIQVDIPPQYKTWCASIDRAILDPTALDAERNYLEASYHLYKTFVEPAVDRNDKTNHLIIVPDEGLRKISFAGLIDAPTSQWINTAPYLINRYSFSYLYYAAQIKNRQKGKKKNLSITAFAMEYDEEYIPHLEKELRASLEKEVPPLVDLQVGKLKNTIPEVTSIAAKFDGKFYTNAEVNKSQLKQHLVEDGIFHFAGHTVVNPKDYLNSALLIHPSENKDFLLRNKDILQLDIDNDLIVLSTCESTSGNFLSGEGLMSLGRSFIYSGSNAVLGNCWKVQDYSTSIIMDSFYENLKNGYSKDVALRQAQLNFLKNENLSITTKSPIFWSGWIIYGDFNPVVERFNTNTLVWMLLLLSIILITGLAIKRWTKG